MWGFNKHPLAKLFRLPDVLRFFLHIGYCSDVFSIVRLSEQNSIWGSNKHPHVKLSGLPECQWFFLHIRQCHMFSPLSQHPSQKLSWGSEKHPSQMCSITSIEEMVAKIRGEERDTKRDFQSFVCHKGVRKTESILILWTHVSIREQKERKRDGTIASDLCRINFLMCFDRI